MTARASPNSEKLSEPLHSSDPETVLGAYFCHAFSNLKPPITIFMDGFDLKRWRTNMTPRSIVITLFSFGIIFLASGLCFRFVTRNMHTYSVRYDDKCANVSAPCVVNIDVKHPMRGRIAMLYQLTQFYQNHRRMFNSKSYPQLAGKYALDDQLSGCQPMKYVNDEEKPENLLIPCGLMAWSFFTDYYRFLNTSVAVFSETEIAVKSDRQYLFRPVNESYKTGVRHLLRHPEFPGETVNEHFIVWMRAAAMPKFLKLFAKCVDCYLPAGNYSIEVKMHYPQSMHSGPRHIVLTETSIIGSSSTFLYMSYLVVGGLSISVGLVFVVHMLLCGRRREGLSSRWPGLGGINTGVELKDSLLDESGSASEIDVNSTVVY